MGSNPILGGVPTSTNLCRAIRMGTPRWYALRTRSRHEKRVSAQVDSRGIEVFLPLIGRRNRWKDRTVKVELPLFPGYCFAHFAWNDRLQVLTAPGVVEVLGVGGQGVPVAETEIENVRRLVTSTLRVDPYPFLEPGRAVEVRRGPLKGLRGFLVRKAAKARLVIAVSLIRQGASVEIDADDVVPV
ncbi:MAG: hypothetical protein C3F12_09640 [Candidatus Methylomirabilota bacterium]|nr:UpxY family transcription antiterminator [candidate division NC10 bacterium]PWB46294.1 MAG: hypothetical protein C3F12_09640 [candidate division NC10 bacterium]